jgi:transcriptional regulator with XRE-family HTH domain
MFTYKSYNFVDKDPIIDIVRTVFQASGLTYKQLAEESTVCVSTISKMFGGTTKRPQAATINAILRAMGHKLSVRLMIEPEIVAGTPAPKPLPPMRHVVQMAKYRKRRERRAAER